MTETFDHPDDDHTGDPGHVPEPDHADHDTPAHDDPLAHDGSSVHDEPPVGDDPSPGEDLAAEAPQLPQDDAASAVWHGDPAADDELRDWLDQSAPALDPPAGFDRHLADELTAAADREGQNVDELVRSVLDRLRRS